MQIQLEDLGERCRPNCKLPQRGLGRSPSGKRIRCILALKSDTWWHLFYYFFLRINKHTGQLLVGPVALWPTQPIFLVGMHLASIPVGYTLRIAELLSNF